MKIYKFDATSGSIVAAVSVAAGNTITVVTVGVWTPGASVWILTITNSDAASAWQTRYCQVAAADGVIDEGGSNQSIAKVFAP